MPKSGFTHLRHIKAICGSAGLYADAGMAFFVAENWSAYADAA